jgi:hypothetical protein
MPLFVLFDLFMGAEPLEPLASSQSEASMEDTASSDSFDAIFQKNS